MVNKLAGVTTSEPKDPSRGHTVAVAAPKTPLAEHRGTIRM
jgi:hypothetical protein